MQIKRTPVGRTRTDLRARCGRAAGCGSPSRAADLSYAAKHHPGERWLFSFWPVNRLSTLLIIADAACLPVWIIWVRIWQNTQLVGANFDLRIFCSEDRPRHSSFAGWT